MMRLITFFCCVGMVGVYADTFSQNISVNINDGKLSDLFKQIQKQSDYAIFYSDRILENHRVTLKAENKDINWILRRALADRSLIFRINGKQITVQERQDSLLKIRGRIYDTKEPPSSLPGVSVKIKGTTQGTTTDADGYFSILAHKGDVLVFSMVSFLDFEYVVTKGDNNLIVALKENVSSLDEVVVMGLTEQQKKHIASSLGSLNVESNIVGKPITSLSQALQGGITGLQVQQSSGMPGGDAATIKIRGISTLGSSSPLILVDGIPMNMDHIDPITVESVTVLKDAAAAAIYGARAANGVILVATKRGTPGKISVIYDGYVGFQTPNYLQKLVDAPTYMRMYNEALQNAGNPEFYSSDIIQKTENGDDPINYPNTNWVDEIISKKSPITNHSLSVDGGNSLARFAITVNYLNQQGMIPNDHMDRFNVRANTSITLNKRFVFDLDLLAIKRNTIEPIRPNGDGGNRILEDVYRVPPTILPKYPSKDGREIYGRYADIVNPLAYAEKGGERRWESGQTVINLQPKWQIFENFNLKGQFSFRLNSDMSRTVADNFNFFDYFTNQLVQTWKVQRGGSMARTTYYYLAANADYTFTKDKHRLYAFAGYSMENNSSGYWDVNSLVSAYTKANYSYDDKYLAEATVRMDGSSKFGPGHKYGYFPSLALGWNIHNENFLSGSDIVKNLKLRGSYGRLGNENIGLYRYQTLIQASNGYENIYGNPDITWEKVNILDVGLDLGLFASNKIELTFDYYNKKTNDVILEPQVSYVGGIGNVPLNAGKVGNKGWELSVNYYDHIGSNSTISIRPGISYNKNRILALQNGPYISDASINSVGSAISSIYGYKSSGLLQASDFDATGNPLVPIMTGETAGDIKYFDLNNNQVIDAEDQTIIGNPSPNLDYFANIRFEFKKFDIEFLLQGTGRSDARLTGMLANPLDQTADGGVPTIYYSQNYWTPEHTQALFPKLSTSPAFNKLSSDFWFQNGAYLRIKYIQLGYNFTGSWLTNIGISSGRIYLNAQNPITFTGLHLMDPESRGNQWTYGIMNVYTVGLNVKI